MLGSTYLWERLFSLMKRKNIFEISGRTDTSLSSVMRAGRTQTITLILINYAQTKNASFLKTLWLEMRHQNRTRMNIILLILYLGWNLTNASFIFGIMVLFSIMKLYLFLKCIRSDLRSLSSLQFDVCIICYLCAITYTVTEVAGCIVNAINKEIQVCVWYTFIRHW